MATRQYIGARYVPKFFNGEGGSTEWVSGVAYEPLTIVTHLGNSFTSKKPVPVGIDILNTEYWASTGVWNTQVEQYKEEVDALLEDFNEYVETNDDKVEALEGTRDFNFKSRKFVFLGDSYNFYAGGWYNGVVGALGISANSYDYTRNGHGFTTTTNWLNDIAEFVSDHSDIVNTITDIVIVGGINDCYTSSFNNLETNITNFITYVKAHFPLAKITMCFVGNAQRSSSVIDSRHYRNRILCINLEQRIFSNNGQIFADGCKNALYQYTLFDSDGLHPNSYGQTYGVIPAVVCAIRGTKFNPCYTYYAGTYPYSGGIVEDIADGFDILKIGTVKITENVSITGSQWAEVGSLAAEVSCSYHEPVKCTVEIRSSNSSSRYGCYVRINNRKIEIRCAEATSLSSFNTFTTTGTTYILDAVMIDDLQCTA